jgi:hypothetical protein
MFTVCRDRFIYFGFILLMALPVALLTVCVPKTIVADTNKAEKPATYISPEEFKKIIIGKSKADVKEIMGRAPDLARNNSRNNDPTGLWLYTAKRGKITVNGVIILDSVVEKPATMVTIYFNNELVEMVDIKFS